MRFIICHNQKVKTMSKYAFNHETDQLTVALGISEKRFDEIVRSIRHAKIDSNNVLELVELSMNALQPKNEVEAMFIGFSIAKIEEVENNPIARLLASMRGGGE